MTGPRLHIMHYGRAPGTAPGTIVVDKEAPPTTVGVMAYGPEGLEEIEIRDPAGIAALRGRWPVIWVNVNGLGDEATLRSIASQFGIHRLALEDVVNVVQRPKVEPYEGHLFVVVRMVHEEDDDRLDTEQVSMFLGRDYVVTFQERPGDCFGLVRERIRTGNGRIRHAGPSYLAYALIDAIIDAFFPVLERFGERVDELEARLLDLPKPHLAGEIHEIKSDLLEMRRAVWPHRDVVSSLTHDHFEVVTDETRMYLRDRYDHLAQIMDMMETYRELASGLLDIFLSSASNRLNEIMKVLTIFAAIFIPLSFVAGVYGMNFDIPELKWAFGYPAALAFMAMVAGLLLFFFWRKGWIGESGEVPRGRPRRERAEEGR